MSNSSSQTAYDKFKRNVLSQNLIKRGYKVVVAVSGGADSIGLLQMLHQLVEKLGYEIVVAHMNHGLRVKEADRDERFVMSCASAMDYEFVCKEVDIREVSRRCKCSIEEAARKERYVFLNMVLREKNAHCIALGHTADDQVETVLMRFLYSGSPHSLGAMAIKRGVYIRPIINIYKKEIEAYLISLGAKWRVDTSNYNIQPERNKIRHHLIPLIEQEYNRGIRDRLLWMSKIMRDEDEYIQADSVLALRRGVDNPEGATARIDVSAVEKKHPAIVKRLIYMVLEKACTGKNKITRYHVEGVWNLLRNKASGKKISLPNQNIAAREFNSIVIGHQEETAEIISVRFDSIDRRMCDFLYGLRLHTDILEGAILKHTECLDWMGLKIKKNMYLDLSKLKNPFVIRGKQPGDRFQQLGLKGNKKLKKVFIERKIPARMRKTIPVVVTKQGIACILGVEIADWAKVTKDTEKTLLLTLEQETQQELVPYYS